MRESVDLKSLKRWNILNSCPFRVAIKWNTTYDLTYARYRLKARSLNAQLIRTARDCQ